MAITLVGTIVSTCDTAGDFTNNNSGANISADDDFVVATGAVGDKMSGSNELLVSDNLLGGAAGVYDFSSGGADEGAHFICWVNTKTSIQATTGIQVMFRNAAGHEGSWYAIPSYFYKGGFTTRVMNPSADFNTATTWTTTGNPAQLDDVTEMGIEFDMLATIMGSFNNAQVDQMTVGFGVRADAGTSGTPNVYQDVVDQDQDTSLWGWFSSQGAKGGLYIGPATGTTASWFVDSAFALKFLDENVAVGFYGIFIRGANTTCTFELASISAENVANSRWSLILDSAMGDTTGGFTDTNSVMSGYDQITLNANATMTGTTFIDGNLITQTGSTLTGITMLEANLTSGSATLGHAILSNNPGLITDSTFTQGANPGHAVRCDTTGTYNWNGNIDSGYTGTRGSNPTSSTGSNNAMFYNNSGGLITLNVGGGGLSPSVRNGAGATTVVNATFTLTLTFIPPDVKVTIVDSATRTELQHTVAAGGSPVTAGSFVVGTQYTIVTAGTTDFTLIGAVDSLVGTTFVATGVGTGTGTAKPSVDITYAHDGTETVDILLNSLKYDPNLSDIYDLALPSSDSSIKFQMIDELNYSNP